VGDVGAVIVEDRWSEGLLAVVAVGWRRRERRANDGVLMLHGLRHGKLSREIRLREFTRLLPEREA